MKITRHVLNFGNNPKHWIDAYVVYDTYEIRYTIKQINDFLYETVAFSFFGDTFSSLEFDEIVESQAKKGNVYAKAHIASGFHQRKAELESRLLTNILGQETRVPVYEKNLKTLNPVNKKVSGFLYIITDIARSVCKIGISTNPKKRLKQIQTGYPYHLTLQYVKFAKNSRQAEFRLHRALSDFRLDGEWFDATFLDYLDLSDFRQLNEYQAPYFGKP